MSAERWKRQERQIAAALGGVRLPNTGAGQCDVRVPGWALQVKTRATLPAWMWSAVAQAERDAGEHETAAVVLAEVKPGRRARRVVCLDFERFAALIAGGTTQNYPETGAVAGAAMSQNVPENDPSRAPSATPAATMATQHTGTPAGTLGARHRGDRPKTRPQKAGHPAAATDQPGAEGGPRWRQNPTEPDTRPMA